MRVLWLCGMKLPIVSIDQGEQPISVGGWLDVLSRKFIDSEYELIICFPSSKKMKKEALKT